MADVSFPATRVVADGVTTDASATVTSATAAFVANDVGRTITGAGIPGATTVSAVGSATSITMSANATVTATDVSITIGAPFDDATFSSGDRTWQFDAASNSWLIIAETSNVLTTADIVDEDNMVSDSATKVPSQQSVKAYADSVAAPVTSVNAAVGVVVLDPDDLDDTTSTNKFASATNVADAGALMKVADGASVENVGAIESNVETASVTTTKALDTSVYGVFDMTMTGNTTFTFTNPAPSGKATSFVLILRGAFTPTWPAAVDWDDGVAPSYTTPAMYVFTTVNGGTNWFGAQSGKAFA